MSKSNDIKSKVQNILPKDYSLEAGTIKNKSDNITVKHSCGYNITKAASVFLRRGVKYPICYPSESKGSLKIIEYLTFRNINFEKEKTFEGLKDKLPLRYDFYLPEINMLIEFDGEQHFCPRFGRGKDEKLNNFLITKYHDAIKNEYALEHNITLLRISYYEQEHIYDILNRAIFMR